MQALLEFAIDQIALEGREGTSILEVRLRTLYVREATELGCKICQTLSHTLNSACSRKELVKIGLLTSRRRDNSWEPVLWVPELMLRVHLMFLCKILMHAHCFQLVQVFTAGTLCLQCPFGLICKYAVWTSNVSCTLDSRSATEILLQTHSACCQVLSVTVADIWTYIDDSDL